jgi:hypothetical protein
MVRVASRQLFAQRDQRVQATLNIRYHQFSYQQTCLPGMALAQSLQHFLSNHPFVVVNQLENATHVAMEFSGTTKSELLARTAGALSIRIKFHLIDSSL